MIFNKIYCGKVSLVPIFVARMYTVLPFLPVFMYKNTLVLLVLAYHISVVFIQQGFHMVKKVRETRESQENSEKCFS